MIRLPYQRKIDIAEMWETFEISGDWEDHSIPIDKDDNIFFIFSYFENEDPDTLKEGAASIRHYRILHQTWDGQYTTAYSLSLHDESLVTFGLYQNGYYIVSKDSSENHFIEFHDKESKEQNKFSIGRYVNRVAVRADGTFAVGYRHNVTTRPSITLFSYKGEILWAFRNNIAYGCLDINIDAEGNFWFICEPENKIYKLADSLWVLETFPLPVSECIGFAVDTSSSTPAFLLYNHLDYMYYCKDDVLYPCAVEEYKEFDGQNPSFFADKYLIEYCNEYFFLGSIMDVNVSDKLSRI